MASNTCWLIIGLDVALFPASLICSLLAISEAKIPKKLDK